jgi:hypothetical protein
MHEPLPGESQPRRVGNICWSWCCTIWPWMEHRLAEKRKQSFGM